jgi:hypothetical protein
MAECECEDITAPKRLWVSYMTHGQRQVLGVVAEAAGEGHSLRGYR